MIDAKLAGSSRQRECPTLPENIWADFTEEVTLEVDLKE